MPTLVTVAVLLLVVGILSAAFFLWRRSRRSATSPAFVDIHALRQLTWSELEILIADYFVREGFVVREQGGKAVDFVMMKDDRRHLVQCKHWRSKKVGEAEVQDLFRHMAAANARSAYLVTIGDFTRGAVDFASGKRIELVDGRGLARLIEDVQQDLSEITQSRLDAARDADRTQPRRVVICPRCGRSMVRREDRSTGRTFYGCSRYPACKGRREVA